ncbi:hypothetical protein [Arthrobacter sp. BE255]|uniref:hypothetical protein n=1 Tax=Arthrobacter sp. BE255 TaxID=2817721 RepID=UPI00286ACBCC|nr:hypothetical protein [Arthrobacter sp. BE255]
MEFADETEPARWKEPLVLRHCPNWLLLVGQFVTIIRDGVVVRRGIVDDVTPDQEALWIAQEGPEHRRLFERAYGFQAWVEQQTNSHPQNGSF